MKKTKSAKNRKKGWKKLDTSAVEDFIEDQRLQERTGGLVAEKTDDQLFFIDTPAVSNTQDGVQQDTQSPAHTGLRKSKRQPKPLKCFAVLDSDARIPAISRQLPGHAKKHLVKANRPVSQKLVKSLEQRKEAFKRKTSQISQQSQLHQEAYDLWSDDTNTPLDDHFAVVTKKKRVKMPSTLLMKPSAVKAVPSPHPGSSYNPTFEDHQELLQKAVTRQVKEDVEAAKLERRMRPNYASAGGAPTQETQLAEMSQGLGVNSESDESEAEQDNDRISVNPPTTRDNMKTKRQKRKRKERLKEAEDRLKEKEERMREDRNMTKQLKAIKKQVERREGELAERAEQRQRQIDESVYQTKRLHKNKFEDLEEDVLLTDELKGTLRLTKSANTLIQDRYKSLQKRNIIEPRTRVRLKRKYKPKHPEKKPFKEITSKSKAGGGIIVPFTATRHGQTE